LDSLSLTEEERRRATEWTFGEGDKKWGISDKGLHLGDITIPIPFGALFGYSMSPNAQKTRQMIREFNEIRQQDIERGPQGDAEAYPRGGRTARGRHDRGGASGYGGRLGACPSIGHGLQGGAALVGFPYRRR
jgi:hypothetical protein